MKKHLTTEQDKLLANHRRFRFNGTDHYLERAYADETKPYATTFYLVPVTTTPEVAKVDGYFKTLGTEVTMEILEQTVIEE